ncbi:glycosyltransferase family 4 protein [Leptolyngbya sp. FACHB-261]|uniref:glycosyltransferase family 4 protein n=1 Tax=Leptolyngbya sp. FACHB-261 TaxID=2692806 RepID=UPI001683F0B7|nr:glycosyltransferase family 4 protein [Leptolyngbya sp. FACHB-261]MBD2101188.1 glycosyltransferase family 4 protein [Leptolyngbya sp. FACHB-261]
MHIAWLGKKSPFCGNVTYSREVTNALLDRGYRVSFLHFAPDQAAREGEPLLRPFGLGAAPDDEHGDWPDCPEFPLPFLYRSQVYTIPSLRASKVLAQLLRQLKPDLIHASLTLSPLDFLLPELCEELGLPLVATFHPAFDAKRRNLASGTQQLMYQLYAPFLANYDRTIVFSDVQRLLLVRLGVARRRLAVIPNGVDAERYSPGPSSIKEELKAERLFVYQGRIAAEKNVEALLKAWKQAKLGHGCKLAMVGDGPLVATLKPFYGPEQGVLWLGFIADEQRRIEILRGADAFILPSLVEGLSLSLLEAMACGTACLATDVGADGEVLANGAGVVLQANQVTSQLATLLPLFRDQPELSSLLGQKARDRVLERYTLSRNISQLEKLYDAVLQQHHRLGLQAL